VQGRYGFAILPVFDSESGKLTIKPLCIMCIIGWEGIEFAKYYLGSLLTYSCGCDVSSYCFRIKGHSAMLMSISSQASGRLHSNNRVVTGKIGHQSRLNKFRAKQK